MIDSRVRAAAARRPVRPVRRPPILSRWEVPVAELPARLDGIAIGHITDVHVQRMVRPRYLDRAIEMLNEQAPDLVCLTGDYVCFHPGAIPRLALSLERLEAKQVVAVLGNHDHWCNAPGIRWVLEQLDIRVLQNEHTFVEVRGERLLVVGVDDAATGHDDPERAFGAAPPSEPTLVLTHDPRVAERLTPWSPALVLAGHTHGGQVKLGRLTERVAARLGHRHIEGFYELGPTLLYVNRGLGASVPLRVGAPPEVALLVLRAAPPDPADPDVGFR